LNAPQFEFAGLGILVIGFALLMMCVFIGLAWYTLWYFISKFVERLREKNK
jgi:hypothetical protein